MDFRPDLVDYNTLKKSNPTHNLQNAFNVAEQQLGVTKLLDPEGEWTDDRLVLKIHREGEKKKKACAAEASLMATGLMRALFSFL